MTDDPRPAPVSALPRVLVTGPASWSTVVHVARLPEPRPHTAFAQRWADGLGGTSAGKAVTLAALGVDVHLRTLLGDDDAGRRVRAALDRPGLTLHALPARDGATERHLNLLDPTGGRVSLYLTLPEAAVPVRPVDLGPALDGAGAAVADLAEHSRPLLVAARGRGVPLWCDVHDDDGAADGYARAFTAAADVVVASAVRLDDPAAYLRARVAEGARLAVCTLGAAGALALAHDGDGERWFEVGTAPVDGDVHAEGAGDAFVAGLLQATLTGVPVPGALARAAATGALAVGQEGLGAPGASAQAVAALAGCVEVRSR
ncbi:sugar/nucleoside kinase (ribokinase family) [Cellulomonas sp. SLBN-39]|nr:sugar/nucleoside kinase (ribokinase family) [Cellulomonas sp. SLBN-39]